MTSVRNSINLGGGLRVNVSDKGIGASWGMAGLRLTVRPNGSTSAVINVPGTPLSYVISGRVGGATSNLSDKGLLSSSEDVPHIPLNYAAEARKLGDEIQASRIEYLGLPHNELAERKAEIEGFDSDIKTLLNTTWGYVLAVLSFGGIFSGDIGAFLMGLGFAGAAYYIFSENTRRRRKAVESVDKHFNALSKVAYDEAERAEKAVDEDKNEASRIEDVFQSGNTPAISLPETVPNLVLRVGEKILHVEENVNHCRVLSQGFAQGEDGSLAVTDRRVIFVSSTTNEQFEYSEVLQIKTFGDGIVSINLNNRGKATSFYALGSAFRIAALVSGFTHQFLT